MKTEPIALSQVVEALLRHSIRVGAARLNGPLKNSAEASFVSGHEFSPAEKACVSVARAGFSRRHRSVKRVLHQPRNAYSIRSVLAPLEPKYPRYTEALRIGVSTEQKTFYIETFGCQMNFHDSEKVVGSLISQGYRQVEREEEADLIFYNTCSIRDKAEQKVFHRLADFKKLQKEGKRFGVLGCVAQQEGEKIFERAPWVSLVAGSASYRNLPEMLVQIESGQARVTGLDDRETDQTFETEFTARSNPHRGYITIIEGCDKFCAYCVVPYTRGKERSRTSQSVLDEARRMADAGYTDIQLLGQNVNSYRDPAEKKSFAELLSAVGELDRHSPRALHHVASARLHQGHHRRHRCGPSALRSRASAGAERFVARAGCRCSASTPASSTWNASPG